MFELYDRGTGNLLGFYPDRTSALDDVREEWELNPDSDLSLGRTDGVHTVDVWAGPRLRGLLLGIHDVTRPPMTGAGRITKLVGPFRLVAAASLVLGIASTSVPAAPATTVISSRIARAHEVID
jgi:hypothetical protein